MSKWWVLKEGDKDSRKQEDLMTVNNRVRVDARSHVDFD